MCIIERTGFTRPFVRPPAQLTVTLREGGGRNSRNIATYVTDFPSDCVARRGLFHFHQYSHHLVFMIALCSAIVLSPQPASIEARISMRLVVTISGNPTTPHQNNNPAPAQQPATDPPTNTTPLTPEPTRLAAPSTSDRSSNSRAITEAETAKGAESLPQTDTNAPQATPQPVGSEVSMAIDTPTGLAVTVSNLEEIVRDSNLRTDVSGNWSRLLSL